MGYVSADSCVAVRVPSAVVPAEHNYILNPQHTDFAIIEFDDPISEYLD
jgi:RES domain-containing protein